MPLLVNFLDLWIHLGHDQRPNLLLRVHVHVHVQHFVCQYLASVQALTLVLVSVLVSALAYHSASGPVREPAFPIAGVILDSLEPRVSRRQFCSAHISRGPPAGRQTPAGMCQSSCQRSDSTRECGFGRTVYPIAIKSPRYW